MNTLIPFGSLALLLPQVGSKTDGPAQWIGSALVLALLCMIAVIGLFFYLNRRLKRQYFTLWTLAWICYVGYLLTALGLREIPDSDLLMLIRRTCIGISGLLMFWGSFQLTFQPRTLRELRCACVLVILYCVVATYWTENSRWISLSVFTLLGSAGIYTGVVYLRRRRCYHGGTVLGGGFVMWGSHLLVFPLLEMYPGPLAVSYMLSAGLAVIIAIAMVVEQEVTVAEKSYRLLFDAASDAVFLVDMWDLRVLEANRAAHRLTKNPEGALLGQSFIKLCPSLQTGNVIQNQRAMQTVFRPYEEFYLVQAGGERVICEGEAAVAEWRQRMVFQVNVRNVGEQRKVAEQIRRAEKLTALGQLVAGVAHELNNPLAIVMGRAQLLLRQPGLPEKVSGDVNSILRQGERASMIVRDLLSYARPREPNKTPVQLNQVIRDVVEWRRTAAESARVRVRLKLDNALPPTLADRVQVEQILNNLVGNAIDALKDQPSPRELELTSEVTASSLRLTVHDNGPGIPAEVREKIFDPFFTTKPLGQGTGLGLTICNTYVTEHRGKLWVETEDGRGTTFFVELPLLDCGEPKPPAPAVAPKVAAPAVELAAAGGGGQRLLIIDDEPDIVMVLESILSESGFQITTANNGNDALHLLSNQDFDVVLSDIRMPGLDGQALYQRVSALKPAMAKRVVFVTGDTVSGATRDFLDKTGNLWLAKPFQLADVLQRVQEVLRRQLHPGAPAVALTG